MSIDSYANAVQEKLSNITFSVDAYGPYQGNWKLMNNGMALYQDYSAGTDEFFFKRKVLRKFFPLEDIESMELLNASKNLGAIVKASVVGAAVAGPAGALAGGALTASQEQYLVKITLRNGTEIVTRMSTRLYEKALQIDKHASFVGIKETVIEPRKPRYFLIAVTAYLGFAVLLAMLSSVFTS